MGSCRVLLVLWDSTGWGFGPLGPFEGWIVQLPEPIFTYCTGKTNSLGCVPSIGTNGVQPDKSNGNFRVTCVNVRNQKFGLLFWGRTASSTPFQGGTKCIAAPTTRIPLTNSGGNPPPDDCSGVYSTHVSQAYMNAKSILAGDTIYAQYWTRDPASLPYYTGLTDGLRFSVCP